MESSTFVNSSNNIKMNITNELDDYKCQDHYKTIVDSFIEEYDLIDYQIKSFDEFIEKGRENVLDDSNTISKNVCRGSRIDTPALNNPLIIRGRSRGASY